MHRFRSAQFLRKVFEFCDQRRRGGEIAAGDHLARIRVRDDVTVHINDEDGAIANARVAQAAEQMVDGDY